MVEQHVLRTSDSPTPLLRLTGQLLTDRFHCSTNLGALLFDANGSRDSGYFGFGQDTICYGRSSSGVSHKLALESLHEARYQLAADGLSVHLSFDPVQVVDNLRCERYLTDAIGGTPLPASKLWRSLYYLMRPLMPVSLRKHLQKLYFRSRTTIPFPKWPVDATVERIFEQLLVLSMKARNIKKLPFIWFWPEGARTCTILTHDVETSAGARFCSQLMDLNDSFEIKSSFQIIPEPRYAVSQSLLSAIRKRGFELNVHDLNHDGHLFSDRKQFLHRARRINQYAKQYDALGFRSAVMYRNIDWYDALDVSYDMSIPNVAHLDPQQGGCCTVFPFFVGKLLELPVTTTQDYTLFHILNDYSIRLWQQQIALVREKYGLISFIIHPDYIIKEEARHVYIQLLHYLDDLRSRGETWIALPREVDSWWRQRSAMHLVKAGDSWRIEGQGSERAKLAYAVLDNDTLTYEFDPPPASTAP